MSLSMPTMKTRRHTRPAEGGLKTALAFVQELRGRPNFVSLAPGARHWDIFVRLCRVT